MPEPNDPTPLVVTFEETGEEREVTRGCRVCRVIPSDLHEPRAIVVAPNGTAHYIANDYSTSTICGWDATRDGWWWSS